MKGAGLFWSVYKNLEQETLNFSRYIHFSSDQKKVYSMSIADIIVRCAVEIEAISKRIYESLGGEMNPVDDNGQKRDLYFDTDCLALIENEYLISKKELIISAPTFYFEESDRIIAPLYKANKRGTSGSKWKQAYQALKHDRYGALKKWGNIECLINALGALYLLNLYFKDTVYQLKEGLESFDARVDSDVFSVFTFDASNFTMSPGKMDDSCIRKKPEDCLERAAYIIKCTDEHFLNLHEAIKKDDEEMRKKIINSPKVLQYFREHPEYKPDSLMNILVDAIGKEGLGQFISTKNFMPQLRVKKLEAVINKHRNIYPTLS